MVSEPSIATLARRQSGCYPFFLPLILHDPAPRRLSVDTADTPVPAPVTFSRSLVTSSDTEHDSM